MSRNRHAWVYRDRDYVNARALLLSLNRVCHEPDCDRPAVIADHDPPLSRHQHLKGAGCCRLLPHCRYHSMAQGARLRNESVRLQVAEAAALSDDVAVEPVGFAADDPLWLLPWIQGFTDVPLEASWPRLMSPPAPAAVGSYGERFCSFAEQRTGKPLRWWQQLVAARLLEHDDEGRLCWSTTLLSTARQVGKSWLLRELLCWRMLQADLFGGPQVVLHTAKDRAVASEIQREIRLWAKARPEFRVTSAHGFELVEHEDGSRWMILAKSAVYGRSAALACVDEAWAVKPSEVEDGLIPTLVEPESSQLLLVSTSNRNTTALMLNRRRAALELLDAAGEGDLLIEWSAPPDALITDEAAWRLASPHWTEKREKLIRQAVARAIAGDTADGDDDPALSARTQWLNSWIQQVQVPGRGDPLFDNGVWGELTTADDTAGRRFTVGLEDWYGRGASVAIAGDLPDGRLQIAGWQYETRAEAVGKVEELLAVLGGRSRVWLVAGATVASDRDIVTLDVAGVSAATGALRAGLSAFRELAVEGRIAWDPRDGGDLTAAVERARVVQRQVGLVPVGDQRTDLLRAAVWALLLQSKPRPQPAIR